MSVDMPFSFWSHVSRRLSGISSLNFEIGRAWYPTWCLSKLVVTKGDTENLVFAPRVFVEFKSLLSKKDAIAQLMESICKEYGHSMRSRGFLIGIEGMKWTIIEYHFIRIRPGHNATECFAISYFHTGRKKHFHPVAGRPSPHEDYDTENPLDITRSKYGYDDLMDALEWIGGKKGRARELLDHARLEYENARHLSWRLTSSTFEVVKIEEEEDIIMEDRMEAERPVLSREEFGYLADSINVR